MTSYTYKELYNLHPDYVVLMTKKFMYEAKDRCARVLSYVMDYKLTQNKDGTVICAGPDRDKMIRALRAHHINFLISEFGVITVKESFKDNGFERYLSLSKKAPVAPVNAITKNDAGPGKALISESPKNLKFVIPYWLQPGVFVKHKKFGNGIVETVSNHRVTVLFADNIPKSFVLPDALEMGYLEKNDNK